MRRFATVFAVLLWVLCLSYGFDRAMRWESTPGASGNAPTHIDLDRKDSRWLLVMVAHTECPCTKASLANLQRILAQYPNQITCRILFCGPQAYAHSPAKNISLAESIEGVSLEFISEQQAANQYGAATSGQVYLYSPERKLMYSGGITLGRNAEGDCAGVSAVGSLIETGGGDSSLPVFGCALQTPGAKS